MGVAVADCTGATDNTAEARVGCNWATVGMAAAADCSSATVGMAAVVECIGATDCKAVGSPDKADSPDKRAAEWAAAEPVGTDISTGTVVP